jgi:hypothetical protein
MILKHDNKGEVPRRLTKAMVTDMRALTGEVNMVTDKATARHRRNRAVTLIEAVLYISIALALIVGGAGVLPAGQHGSQDQYNGPPTVGHCCRNQNSAPGTAVAPVDNDRDL